MTDPDVVLADLREAAEHHRVDGAGTVPEHHPVAAVLACSDARVPPQLVFDQEPGRLFTVRVAGHLATPVTVASLTYATEVLGVGVVVVLGHEGCGAVTEALRVARGAGEADEALRPLLDALVPAVTPCADRGDCSVADAVVANVRTTVTRLRDDPGPLGRRARQGRLRVVGAVFDIASGSVRFL